MFRSWGSRWIAILVHERFECSVVRIAHLLPINEQVRAPLSPPPPDHDFLSSFGSTRAAALCRSSGVVRVTRQYMNTMYAMHTIAKIANAV